MRYALSADPNSPTEMALFNMEVAMNQRVLPNSAETPMRVGMNIITQGFLSDFAEIEIISRRIGSRIFYIAADMTMVEEGTRAYLSIGALPIPGFEDSNPDRILWVCVNGPDEAEETLSYLAISSEENLEYLKSVGALVAATDSIADTPYVIPAEGDAPSLFGE